MKRLLIESHYLPTIEYFVLLDQYGVVEWEGEENFQKQSYRNRAEILGPNKIQKLIVPVRKSESMKMSEVQIDYEQGWQKDHWRAIISAYNRSPYFEFYKDDLEEILTARFDRLIELNQAVMTFCLRSLEMEKEIEFSNEYKKTVSEPSISDYRNTINPKRDFLEREIIRPVAYHQVFGKAFAPNLSIIDLLFCEGPLAAGILRSWRAH